MKHVCTSSLGVSYLEYRFGVLDLPVRRVFPLPPVHDPAVVLDAADAPLVALDAVVLGPDDDLDTAPLSSDADRDLAITGVLGDELPSEDAAGPP